MSKAVSIARRLINAVFILTLLLPANNGLQAQTTQASISTAGKTYAVVIGISKYKSKGIRKLQFANRDAEEFAAYLKSVAVPSENIRLLTDSLATTAAIYDALNWLLETCAENDVVYFYFSGHGDMENTTIYKLGFLLAQNTPRNNFINNALRIEDLNNVANTLSVENKAKVILITDACHSGKLTGAENRGKFLVGEQLRKAQRNEIRITSCAADELSAENEQWGGGRGVFSYYLVNGLKGLAEKQNDGFITLQEIKTYLDSSFAKDAVLSKENHKQTPVIPVTINNADFRLAPVMSLLLKTAQEQVATDRALQQTDEAGISNDLLSLNPVDYFFISLKEKFSDRFFDFAALNQLEAGKIPSAFIAQVNSNYSFFQMNKDKLGELEKAIAADSEELKRFKDQMVVILHDNVQTIINLYLEADAAELERRRYYNAYSSSYDIYPSMLAVALKLADKENLLRHILEVNMYYLSGLAARIKIPLVKDRQPLITTALANLEKAYALEKEAPYILNELGILYRLNKQPAKALEFYKKAADLSSEWALPWANMSAVYAELKNYSEGFAAAAKAKELDPVLQNSYINSGALYEMTENYLLAEEEFRKSIKLNTRHYLPFEHLGRIYMNTTRYQLADSFFFEAALRKKGYFFISSPDGIVDQFVEMVMSPAPPCPFDTSRIGKTDVMGNFVWGMRYLEYADSVNAERKFKQVIRLDPLNPLAFHYLGVILYHQQRWAEADIILNFAIQNHLDSLSFLRYTDSLRKLNPAYNDIEHCVVKNFIRKHYKRVEDRYFLATAYEKWNHFAEAEKQCELVIAENGQDIGGYYKLWNLYEKTGRYTDAEATIQNYATTNSETAEKELNGFYRRMMERLPEKAEWFYKAGIFLYDLARNNPGKYRQDQKYIVADTDEEKFWATKHVEPQQIETSPYIPGTDEHILVSADIVFPLTDGINYLREAESMVQEAETLAEINYKIGDLYVWQGLPGRASAFYKKSVDLFPADANTRIKLLDTYVYGYQFREALEQLDSLKQRREINFSKMLQMAEFCTYARRYTDAGGLLKTAESIHPYQIPEIINLNGRVKLLEKRPKEAIVYYKNYLTLYQDDAETMYSLAKLYAQAGNSAESWKWLQSALQKGFRYGYVLAEDSVWDKLRPTAKWQQLLKNHPMKKYLAPDGTEF